MNCMQMYKESASTVQSAITKEYMTSPEAFRDILHLHAEGIKESIANFFGKCAHLRVYVHQNFLKNQTDAVLELKIREGRERSTKTLWKTTRKGLHKGHLILDDEQFTIMFIQNILGTKTNAAQVLYDRKMSTNTWDRLASLSTIEVFELLTVLDKEVKGKARGTDTVLGTNQMKAYDTFIRGYARYLERMRNLMSRQNILLAKFKKYEDDFKWMCDTRAPEFKKTDHLWLKATIVNFNTIAREVEKYQEENDGKLPELFCCNIHHMGSHVSLHTITEVTST